jgi:D-arabinose 1-dehydrogenase-like Zn-dependent alcohol dehydrogenase
MTETYSLDEITKAYERVAEGKVRFRAVITTSLLNFDHRSSD